MNIPPTQDQIWLFANTHNVSTQYARRTLLNDYFFKEIEDIKKPATTVSLSSGFDSLEGKFHRLVSIVEYLVTQI